MSRPTKTVAAGMFGVGGLVLVASAEVAWSEAPLSILLGGIAGALVVLVSYRLGRKAWHKAAGFHGEHQMRAQWLSAPIDPDWLREWQGTFTILGLVAVLIARFVFGLNNTEVFSWVSSAFGGLLMMLGLLWVFLLSCRPC